MLIKLNLQRFASDYVTWATANGHIEASLKFKHLYANDKIGTGTYKFKHFSIIEPTPQVDSISAGTYIINENPTLNIDIDITLNGKMNTLTYDNTYGEMVAFNNVTIIASTLGSVPTLEIANIDEGMVLNYTNETWVFIGDRLYTTNDITKLRTITIETDQEVSQEFKNWWDENTIKKTGFTVTYTNSANSSAPCKYTLDGGNTWTTITESSGTIENVETIKFLLNYNAGMYGCKVVSTTLGLNKNSSKGYVYTDTYTLTKDVSDLKITMTPAK